MSDPINDESKVTYVTLSCTVEATYCFTGDLSSMTHEELMDECFAGGVTSIDDYVSEQEVIDVQVEENDDFDEEPVDS